MLQDQLLLLFISWIAISKCDIFHFKANLSCSEPYNCQFYQPEIWHKSVGNHNNSVPIDGDSIYLIGNNATVFSISIPEDSHILLELLYVSGNFTLMCSNKTQPYGKENNVEPIALLVDENSSLKIYSVGVQNTGTTQLLAGAVLAFDSAIASLLLSSPGTGSINITDSDIKLSNPHLAVINETVAVNGNSSVTVDGIEFTNNNLIMGTGITLFVIKWMEISGNFFIPGAFLVLDGHLVMRGNIYVSGGVSVFGGTFLVTDALSTGSAIILDAGQVGTGNIVLQSPLILSTPMILSQNGCTIATRGPITILGSVINGGVFYVNKFLDPGVNQNIAVFGNYTQAEGGTHVAFLAKDVSAAVTAENVLLSGILSYVAYEKVPESFNFVVFQATTEISGKFNGNLHSYATDKSDLGGMQIVYFPYSIALVIGKASHKLRNGIIIGLICVVLVAVAAIGVLVIRRVRKTRKSGDYELLVPTK